MFHVRLSTSIMLDDEHCVTSMFNEVAVNKTMCLQLISLHYYIDDKNVSLN